MNALGLVGLTVAARRRRLFALVAFGGLFLAAAIAARLLLRDEHGHVDLDTVFVVGGYPLASAMLLMGWVLGRYPLIATVVLLAGLFSHDRSASYARLYAVRPTSLLGVYAIRFAALAGAAFLLSAVLMPVFDLLLLGTWAGPATLVLILAYVLAYGGLMALFSVWTGVDVWLTVFLAIFAIVWNALDVAGVLVVPPGMRDVISFVLPPQAALLRLEEAFAGIEPIPWDAFLHVAGYGIVMLTLAALSFARREI
ncbi:MAG TPA: hypothetical protein VNZ57_11210 [Longimicrobiales bacterium]|nr:hypothetical protein [Longimicrobiales bacterium]